MYRILKKEAVKSLKNAIEALGWGISGNIKVEEPPNSDMGDIASSVSFQLAKQLKRSPMEITQEIMDKIETPEIFSRVESKGPYINFFADYNKFAKLVLESVDDDYGRLESKNTKIILEHTSANPNGPLHIGHIRNSIIGDSLARILRKAGYEVETQYYVNDMGRQIAMIVWGLLNMDYQMDPEGKPDHEIGKLYFNVNEKLRANPELKSEINTILKRYEKGKEKELQELFKTVVEKCIEGIKITSKRLNIEHDAFTWESTFVKNGDVENILKTLEGRIKRNEVPYLDLNEYGIEKELILTRSDGTSLYATRDLAYHLYKSKNFDEIVDVYQREADIWSKNDEQYLIDTILRGFGMPAIFIHSKNGYEYIVDGQQRINIIWKFQDDKIPLNPEYSKEIINDPENIEYNNGNPSFYYHELSMNWKNIFDSYPLPIINLNDYNDEEIRDLFRRLQRGKPLITGEILNSYPGPIVPTMRKLAEHKYFKQVAAAPPGRYNYNQLVAQFMFLERVGIREITPTYLYRFFKNNENLNTDSDLYKNVSRILNYLTNVFQTRTPELNKGWNITIYLFISYLLKNYAMNHQAQKENLREFVFDFYHSVPKSKLIDVEEDKELINFSLAMVQGTNSERNIKLRHEIILKRFFQVYNPPRLDEQRSFNKQQKIEIFRRDGGRCNECKKELTFGDINTHYHHKIPHSKGGKTKTENGLLECAECHLRVLHGSKLTK
ncbi:MAG: arginine--tRNA ligase [Methanobacterium paludis]|nr:arginine--tRNA ligase [Methanobacterium paludis]